MHTMRKERGGMSRYRCYEEFFHSMKKMPSSPAVLAPGRKTISFEELCGQIEYAVAFLNGHGLGRDDRIGVVLPNGPDMAVLFLSVMAAGIFVPLSPFFREPEYDSYMADLKINALIVSAGSDSAACSVAAQRGIPVIELTPRAEAGLFRMGWKWCGHVGNGRAGFPGHDDIALVLGTSGTTSRPKVVPLSQGAIFSSAWYTATSLCLTEEDRCLNIMPMYHIAGLVTPVLASLSAGGSVICSPRFSAEEFFDWIAAYSPTWYSAVPAMHQAIVAQAGSRSVEAAETSLRFVRSTTSPLYESLFRRLEDVFKVRVIQSYGLTEALPISSTPLDPYKRKPASVGTPVSEIAIVDEGDGSSRKREGEIGEIVVRGPQVFRGYENDPRSSGLAFRDGWFRTGDLGYYDEDGFLYLTGRVKEMINRGGQKVSPQEVEAVLMDHEAVSDAAVFGIPHLRLNEAVAAVVVVYGAAEIGERELLDHVSARLAPFKVPQHIIVVDQIPKGATGKLQRTDLAQRFGHLIKADFVSPSTKVEEVLTRVWEDLLETGTVGAKDNFFELGGDSLMVHQVLTAIEEEFGVTIPPSAMMGAPTISQLAEVISAHRPSKSASCLVSIRSEGRRVPLFCLPHVGGDLLLYHRLAKYLDSEQPVYGLEISKEVLQYSMEETASLYIEDIRGRLPSGPFGLLGFSSGGLMAFEMARQLHEMNFEVPYLGILDTTMIGHVKGKMPGFRLRTIKHSLVTFPFWAYHYLPVWLSYYWKNAKKSINPPNRDASVADRTSLEIEALLEAIILWQKKYAPGKYAGRITFYRASAQALYGSLPDMGWGSFSDDVHIHVVPGTHTSIIKEPQIRVFAEKINKELRRVLPTMP